MHLSHAILGTAIVAKLEDRRTSPVLLIGSDSFSRPDLSKIGCFNFLAAARLTHVLTFELKVKHTRDLFFNFGPQHLAIPGLGAISLATIGAAFECKGLGTLADYIARHMAKGDHVVTFTTMKVNVLDQQAARKERKDRARRKDSRRRQAHEIRVDRHVARSAAH